MRQACSLESSWHGVAAIWLSCAASEVRDCHRASSDRHQQNTGRYQQQDHDISQALPSRQDSDSMMEARDRQVYPCKPAIHAVIAHRLQLEYADELHEIFAHICCVGIGFVVRQKALGLQLVQLQTLLQLMTLVRP